MPVDLKPRNYAPALGVFDLREGKERAVDFALKASARDADGYYRLTTVFMISATPGLNAVAR